MSTFDHVVTATSSGSVTPKVLNQLFRDIQSHNQTANIFYTRTDVTSGSLNDLTTPGFYSVNNTAVTERPNAYYCSVIVITAASRVIQTAITTEVQPKEYRRRYERGVWTEWVLKDVSTDSFVSSNDVTSGSLNDLTTPGFYSVNSTAVTERPNAYYCSVTVNAAGGRIIQTAITVETKPNIFRRVKHPKKNWEEWVNTKSGSSDVKTVSHSLGSVKKRILEEGLSARKSFVSLDGEKGAIALRFDDAPQEFEDRVLPLLKKYRLPYTRVTTSDTIHTQVHPEGIFDRMQEYALESGGEVWNHGRTHREVVGEDNLYNEIVGSLDKLSAAMPELYIDCFAPPGGGVKYNGAMPTYTRDVHYNTYSSQMIFENHAIITGYLTGTLHYPLDGIPRNGYKQYSADTLKPARINSELDIHMAQGTGSVLMYHANNIGGSGITLSEFETILAKIADLRNKGELFVCTVSGLHYAKFAQRRYLYNTNASETPSVSLNIAERPNVVGANLVIEFTGSNLSGSVTIDGSPQTISDNHRHACVTIPRSAKSFILSHTVKNADRLRIYWV